MAKRRKSDSSSDDQDLFASAGDASAGDSAPPGSPPGTAASSGSGSDGPDDSVTLLDATRSRYLNYALSVITSRALPDVRDGLKPVQRRILYTMWQNGLDSTAKHRKSATVVGDVMGRYHPHGDSAIYDAMVRMAQPWVMRATLVDGSGNFGSMDGDAAAAYRYTECRLAPIATELLQEIGQSTVTFRPNYDGTKEEPVVLPARIPNTLLNGSTGIAVGMATNIPPHNLGELCKALIKLLDDPDLKEYQLVANDAVQGPDFPTGGHVLNTRDELREIYKTGQGAIRIRGTWEKGPQTRSLQKVFITSVPYGVNKAVLVEEIAQIVLNRKLPLLLDVRDISTTDVRIELDIKRDSDEQMVMAYLFKHTSLQTNFNVNMTVLIPTENPAVGRPERIGLKEILWHFLHFRLDVVTRRLEHELRQLEKRIHILEGFAAVFDALDEIIRIIRKSEGKADAAAKIIDRFKLDADQTDAILELKLYRLARLEILVIQEELKEKQKRAAAIRKLLSEKDAQGRWGIVRSEIEEIVTKYVKGDPLIGKRRTIIEDVGEEPQFSADDFIIDEDNHVIVTRDGWVKRQKEVRDLSTTRLREGDAVLAAEAGSTRATVVFFSNFGTAYSCRIIEIPASTGYGEPIQKLFKLKDGERIINAISLDPRSIGDIGTEASASVESAENLVIPPVHAFAASSDGYALRLGLAPFREPSTRSGRRYARPSKDAEIVGITAINGSEIIIAATRCARATLCKADEVNFLAGAGKGVILIKLANDDSLLGFKASTGDRDLMEVETSRGATQTISTAKYEVTSRGGKGREIMQRGQFLRIIPEPVSAPGLVQE